MRQVSGLSRYVCKNACKLASKFSDAVYVPLGSCWFNWNKLISSVAQEFVAQEFFVEPSQEVPW